MADNTKQIEADLYLMKADYRSPKKNKELKGANFNNYKKNTYVWAIPYRGGNENATYGEMVIVDNKYIIPSNFCHRLTAEQRDYVLKEQEKKNINTETKSQAEAETQTSQPTVEQLNNQGREAVKDKIEKVETLSLKKIENIKRSYVSTGVLFGAVGGFFGGMFLKKGIAGYAGCIIGGMILGGMVGDYLQKKHDKDKVENDLTKL